MIHQILFEVNSSQNLFKHNISMGKVKKIKVSKPVNKIALDRQIEDDKYAKAKNRSKERSRQDEEDSVRPIN